MSPTKNEIVVILFNEKKENEHNPEDILALSPTDALPFLVRSRRDSFSSFSRDERQS